MSESRVVIPEAAVEATRAACLWCGAEFEPVEPMNDNPHLYCSKSHKYKRKNARAKMRGKSLDGICPYQFKIQFSRAGDASGFPAFNAAIHDAYPCRCGYFHYGRKVLGGYKRDAQ